MAARSKRPRSAPLSAAWLIFPPANLRRARAEPKRPVRGPNDAWTKMREGMIEEGTDVSGLDATEEMLASVHQWADRVGAEWDLRRWLFRALKAGRLMATGYAMHEGRAAIESTPLPPFMFEEHDVEDRRAVDWARSEIRRAGHHFISVQVADEPRVGARPDKVEPVAVPRSRGAGRPSFRGHIDDVIAGMRADGLSIVGPPWSELILEVRRRGQSTHPNVFSADGRRPNGDTIRRRLVAGGSTSKSTSKL